MAENGRILYTLDGRDFRDYGIYVSDSAGIIDLPKMKGVSSVSWDDYHGEEVDLRHKYYEPREITLSCFVKAENKADFIEKISAFVLQFTKRGLCRLVIYAVDGKPLVYDVYCKDGISITKKWSDKLMVGTFKLKVVEPHPIKRVLSFFGSGRCSITLTSKKMVSIFWGDGTADEDVSGNSVTISHNYSGSGANYPVVAGCIDEIDSMNTNASIVWDKL